MFEPPITLEKQFGISRIGKQLLMHPPSAVKELNRAILTTYDPRSHSRKRAAGYAQRYENFVLVLVATVSAFCWPWAFLSRDSLPTTTANGAVIVATPYPMKGIALDWLLSFAKLASSFPLRRGAHVRTRVERALRRAFKKRAQERPLHLELFDDKVPLGQGGEAAAARPRRGWFERLGKNYTSSGIPASHTTPAPLRATSSPQLRKGVFAQSSEFRDRNLYY